MDSPLPQTPDFSGHGAPPDDDSNTKKSWISQYWVFWLVLAFIVYETTSQPALATLIACIKVGWDEFSMAHWLLKVDPDRSRVVPKMALYIAYGLWKIAITSCLVLIGVFWMVRLIQPNGVPVGIQVFRAVQGVSVSLMLGFGLSTLFTLFSFTLAIVTGSRLYAGRAVTSARMGHYWPPVSCPAGFLGSNGNFARWLLFTALFMLYGVFGAVVAVNIRKNEPNPARREAKSMLFLSVLGLGCMGAYLYLNRKVVAQKPEDCWALPEWAMGPTEVEMLPLEVDDHQSPELHPEPGS